MREKIVNALVVALSQLDTVNYVFEKKTYWQDTDTQYEKNHLDLRDTTAEMERQNKLYQGVLNLEITAIVWASNTNDAANLGTMALNDLIRMVRNLVFPCSAVLNNIRSNKWIETRGKTACHVQLELQVNYKI